ncbi:MAG: LysR family transcriptional regulator [Tabrizicola sp.]|nr:LysR family transcriptional regulator [Tabrizicola sp.]
MCIDWFRLPPLASLRAFAAAAEHGGFTQAGRALNVTHAAVAQQVRALEDQLGLSLLRRDGRGLSLTAEGAELAAALSEGFASIQRGIEALKTTDADRPVRVTLTASFAAQWLMPRLRDFWDKNPDIGLAILPDSAVVDLHRERMDLGLRYGNGNWPGVEAVFLASARLVVVAAPSLMGDKMTLTPDEMRSMEWVITQNWPEQDNYLRSLGLEPSELSRTDFSTDELSISAARQGLGLTVESNALVENDLREGRLRLVHESQSQLPAYFIVWPPGPMREEVRRFLRWLKSQK